MDISKDIFEDIPEPETLTRRVETDRFGPFTFRLGLDLPALTVPRVRLQDAQRRFAGSPLAQVANRLEPEVLVESVHGTNTIEGGDLTPEETREVLALPPEQLTAERQQRVRNVRDAHALATATAADPAWRLNGDFLRAVHVAICRDLSEDDYRPGVLRANGRDRVTRVGDAAHGGVYKPPQHGRDIERLLDALVGWHSTLVDAGVPAIVRAPLVHLYFERIHPFWDGNGRVGRVVEATLLLQAGFRYAPFALWRYYLDRVDDYFSLFNTCRKADEAGHAHPNQAFVAFHLEGMRQTLDALHDRVNRMVAVLLFEAELRSSLEGGRINVRQYAIMRLLVDNGEAMPLSALRQHATYLALYRDKTDKTRQRDLRGLREQSWLRVDSTGMVWPGFIGGSDDGAI
mgnify:CR=1 FL=1